MSRLIWVIGARGLLGSAIVRRARLNPPDWTVLELPPLPWGRSELAEQAGNNFSTLISTATAANVGWSIVWAAGVSVVGSAREQTEVELREFRTVLAAFRRHIREGTDGSIFFASSAGAVYAGSHPAPFTESTDPSPTSPYGELKMDLEAAVTRFAQENRIRAVIGRISNLYGPGQSLDKAQGLISHLVLSRFGDHPVSIFVPMETVRDYLFVDDGARLALDSLHRISTGEAGLRPTVVIKILASGQGTSISSLLGHLRYLTKISPAVAIGSRPISALHSADLRMNSEVWPDLDRRELVPLAAGFHATILDVLRRLQG